MNLAIIASTVALIATATSVHPATSGPQTLVDLADRYCIGPDGDHELTWAQAVRDGMTPLEPNDFQGLRLPGARGLRGFTHTLAGVEVRLLTAHNAIGGGGAGLTFYKMCWVSAEPMDRRPVDRTLQRDLGMRGFRQEGARMFAWIPREDGSTRAVSRREWQVRGQALSRDEGMRAVLVNDRLSMVSVAYMTPNTDCVGVTRRWTVEGC